MHETHTQYDYENDSFSERFGGLRGDLDSVPSLGSFDSPKPRAKTQKKNYKNVSFLQEDNHTSQGRKVKRKQDLRKSRKDYTDERRVENRGSSQGRKGKKGKK